MEMEVPVENNINIGNGISNIMPLHNASRGPIGQQAQLVRTVRSESRDRDLNMGGDIGNYPGPPISGQSGFGPPSYGTGIVSNATNAPPYYNVTSNGGITPSVSATHPTRTIPDNNIKPTAAGDAPSHRDRDREREIIRETIGNRQPPMVKIAVVGESTVGKSTVCKVFTSETDTFSKNYTMTCGVDVYAKYIVMPAPYNFGGNGSSSNANNMEEGVNLVLLDSSGKDIYYDLLPRYWDKIDGVVLMVDLTSASSLENAQRWLDLAKTSLSSTEKQKMLGVLIGNKMDLTEQRIISPKMAKDFAIQYNLEYFECSAKEGSGLEEPFFYLAYQWTTRLESNGNGAVVKPGGGSVVGASTGGSNKEQNHREKSGISAVGSSRHSAFQRKGTSNTSSHQSQGSMDFI